jgi:hypothetical protein
LSENDTPWSTISTIISGFFTFLGYYLNIEPFKILFSVLFGAMVTFWVQDRLGKNTEKREINRKYVEDFYAPLLAEIHDIQGKVLHEVSMNYDRKKIERFIHEPQFYTMAYPIREDYQTFAYIIESLLDQIRYYNRYIQELIRAKGNIYLAQRKEANIDTVIFHPQMENPILLRYNHKAEFVAEALEHCFLRDQTPLEIIEYHLANLQKEFLNVEYDLLITQGENEPLYIRDIKPFSERENEINNIIADVKQELLKDNAYQDFKTELHTMRKRATDLVERLSDYINEYLSLVDI